MTAPDWLTAAPFTHRGLHDPSRGIPENSLAAFEASVEAGFPIELDVQRSADGRAVVAHDRELGRVTGLDVRVDRSTWAQMRDLRLGGTDEGLPLLGDVLDLVAGRVGLMVEIKNFERRTGPVEQAVADLLDGYDGPVCVASFNPGTVGWFATHRPDVLRGQTAGPMRDVPVPGWLRFAMSRMLANVRTRPHFLSYDLTGLPDPIVELWRRGRPLVTWTVRTPDDLVKARAVADNFIFEGVAVPPVRGGTSGEVG